MDRSNREGRHYKVTPLSTLNEGSDINQNRDLLLKLYDQVCSAWKELVGVRFKLLGLVPTVSLALLATILPGRGAPGGLSLPSRLLIAAFGFLVTFGLFVYDRRNSALHDDLISRGRKIEDELGVDTGIFKGRLNASGIFKHDIATNVIYGVCMIGWLVAVLFVAYAM
jgi:hypothetical protein